MKDFNNEKIYELINILKKTYPNAKGSLDFTSPFELLVAVILSAQCTDKRVNIVTKELFKKYNTPESIDKMDISLLEKYISTCGLYKQKAKSIKKCANIIVLQFNSNVPDNMKDLLSLPGIGRKSANVILLDAFNISEGIAVDTHVKRISNRLGLTTSSDQKQIEKDLVNIFPSENYKDINHLLIYHGREICKAKNPKCEVCPISHLCNNYKIAK